MVNGTLNELYQLKTCGFGQPTPRHGLNMLYWFACDYIEIDSISGNIVPKTNPKNGHFGFHKFQNRIEDDEDPIVPPQSHLYYEVGNLNAPYADKLPTYVRPQNIHYSGERNKDRIIVRLDNCGNIERVYVTQHSDTPKQFDKDKTYRVSKGLLKIIRSMRREVYLSHFEQPEFVFQAQSLNVKEPENNSWCAIL